jgi:hypothetical protein
MQSHQPVPLCTKEWDELAKLSAIRDTWDLAPMGGAELASISYGVKFDFVNMGGGPPYIGDLFIVHCDHFRPPIVLVRDRRRLWQLSILATPISLNASAPVIPPLRIERAGRAVASSFSSQLERRRVGGDDR